MTVDPATNRITNGGVSYDAAGNMTAMPGLTMTYDTDNRMISNSSGETYTYDASGLRAAKTNGSPLEYYFYGVDGSLLQRWTGGYNVYFGGKLIYNGNGTTVTDRLGSVVEKDPSTATRYFPYGDEPAATEQNRPKFATYYRDSATALDYAQQRYYSSTLARFTSPDPYRASGGPADPQSWNRYAYVQNDPVNGNDPRGLETVEISGLIISIDVVAYSGFSYWAELMGILTNGYRYGPTVWIVDGQYLDVSPLLAGIGDPSTSGGGGSPAPTAPTKVISVKNYSTTSLQAVGVQNTLRWLQAAIPQLDPGCDAWLTDNQLVISQLLGETGGAMMVGVGSFSTTDNAVQGTGGTDLPSGTGIAVNLNGQYFVSGSMIGYGTTFAAGTGAAMGFILLHELAHATGAAGFIQGDSSVATQTSNN